MLCFFCVECRDKKLINKKYNAYSVVATHGKRPRVDFAFARQPWAIKGTTLTALHHYNIHNCGCVHWDIGITPMSLRAITLSIGIKFLLRDYFKLFLLFIQR